MAKHTRESLLQLLKNFNISTMADFRRLQPAACLWYGRHKSEIGELPLNFAKKSNNHWTFDAIQKEAQKYQYKSDFQNQSKGAYLKAIRENWLESVCAHMISKPFKASGGKPGIPAQSRIDLSGQTFGEWKVLGLSDKRQKKQLMWDVVCACGTTAIVSGHNLKQNLSTKCLKCSKQISKPQVEIFEFIKSLGFLDAVLSDRSTGREIDIYVPSKQFAIEYDGLIWHSTKFRASKALERSRLRHYHTQNIDCFRIFEDEWLTNKELILAMIKRRLLGQPNIKCEFDVKYIDNPAQYKQFFKENHIDGYGASLFAFGAFQGDKLISCMTFRRYTKGQYKGQLELARFCSDFNVNTYGVFSRLLKAVKNYARANGYEYIVSASDNRLSKGAVYKNNGFKEIVGADYQLNYYYYLHSKGRRIHRFNCRKLKPPKISDADYAKYPTERIQCESGFMAFKKYGKWEPLYKIYGWGNKLWVLQLK